MDYKFILSKIIEFSPIIFGSIIGYFTNFLAIKMLFRPKKEYKIFNKNLPFTPGIFPKNKSRIANKVASSIKNELLNGTDIKNHLLKEDTQNIICSKISEKILNDNTQIKDHINRAFQSESYCEVINNKISNKISEYIAEELSAYDLKEIVQSNLQKVLKEKISGSFLAAIVPEEILESIASSIGSSLDSYVKENATNFLKSIIEIKLVNLENQSSSQIVNNYDIKKEAIENTIKSIYSKFVQTNISTLFDNLQTDKIIEAKINAMSNDEFEKLILSVMKKELSAVINLGFIIGAFIGGINIILNKFI